ncbi:diacylglycerol kinase [Chimaeribacter arupi]|uniref:Diacylglycerol kinase n=2 Tax=Yersiniaceae TaxID=1903411 RepID=A0A2N5EIF1_9GAMM|nr:MULTISPECIES: diacylglycerol kinase [Yersiniaceae]MBS0970381.1 diacylglycerol kinase [Nissabacter archeti]MDV5138500.1 diacylglycerol kinase [Chimaeribacter arupi]PLR37677.1 diacylglycerol kinase [Chimaeribacter arupi]PLR44555.1 diacylglycerol kinase [Chimaeribacter arupi]PLR45030.1 diacylglycerol kinase [Chimaeribacter arupi]
MANQTTGLIRIYKAAGYSVKGVLAAWKNEAAFRQEAIMVIPAMLLAFWLDVSTAERILMVSSLWLILIVEIINSAIEAIVDRIGPELHPLSGRAKDLGSAAVALAIILTLFVWAMVLLPRLF